jgi:hypothetical protein
MSSLKEKAKTSYSICEKAYLTCEVCEPQNKCGSGNCPLVNVLWVRLEDAERTLAELKQKLQQFENFLNEFPDINNEKYKLPDSWVVQDIIDTNALFIKDVSDWKKKFEELLKEEKEVKPT